MNAYGSITDVPGTLVGHAQRVGDGWLTGVTVVVPPRGSVGAVDVRGGGPGTHETDALAPGTLVDHVDAIVLTGGSAYGLASAAGAQAWCEEQGRGVAVGPQTVVPVVPAAAVFDLGRGGDPALRPDAALGHEAASAAAAGPVGTGGVGAGTGAVLAGGTLTGGVGTASVRLPGGVVVGALAVVNAAGSPCDAQGALYARAFVDDPALRPPAPSSPAENASPPAVTPASDAVAPSSAPGTPTRAPTGAAPGPPTPGTPTPPALNTTLVVVATNARLDCATARRTAAAGHDGLARALRPVHTLADGDTVFAVATGEVDVSDAAPSPAPGWPAAAAVAGVSALQAAAADAVMLAVLDAVLSATSVRTPALDAPAYLRQWPSGRPPGYTAGPAPADGRSGEPG